MANLEPNKWQGIDVISLLLGGTKNKLESAGQGLETLANFMKDVNDLKKVVQEGVDLATAALQGDIEKFLKINPLKEVLDSFVGELRDSVKDLQGSGVYFLDMNATVPPMWSYGFTFEEAKIEGQIGNVKKSIYELDSRLLKTDDTDKQVKALTNQVRVLEDRKNSVRRGNFGGTAKYAQTFNDSLTDELDFNRPILSGDAEIAALFIMFGSSSLGQFFKTWDSFNKLIKTFKKVPTDGYLPLQNLRVKYTSTDVYDEKYTQLKTYLDNSFALFEKLQSRSLISQSTPFLGCLVVRNNESNDIESIVPIYATVEEISKMKAGASISSSIPESEIQSRAQKSKIPVYLFSDNNDKYFELRNITCILDKYAVESTGLDIDNFYYDRGKVDYIPGGKSFDFLRRKNVEVWDKDAPDSSEGNVILYWEYPKQAELVTKAFRGVYRSWENIYILRKKITIDNPYDDMQALLLTGVPDSVDGDSLQIIPVSSWFSLRKSYFDKVEDIEEASDQGVLGYAYAVAGGYTVTERFSLRDIISGGIGFFHYPIYTVLHNENSPESQEIIKRTTEERKSLLSKLEEDGDEEALSFRAMLIEKYSKVGGAPEEIPVKLVTFSNVADLTIPTDYDLTQSTPPDWKRFPHLTMAFPQIFQVLNQIVEVIDTLVNYVKDAFDFITDIGDALKSEADYYLNKIIEFVTAIQDIIKALADLAFGAYVMLVKIPSGAGGLDELKKILAMSLTGNLSDVPWSDNEEAYEKFQAGPPPYGRDDYVGGYCLMGGAADFLVELLEALVQGDLDPDFLDQYLADIEDFYNKHIKGIEDTFSEDYSKMADAADQQKEDDVELETVTIDVPSKDEEVAAEAAYLSGAIDALNSGDTPALAGFLANAMGDGYDAAREAALLLKNYDGSEITSPSLLAFINGLGDVGKMKYAAELLRLTGERLPYVLSLFVNDDDATAYNNFKLILAQAIAEQLAGITVNESLRGVVVSVTSIDNIDDRSVGLETDNYVVGLNVAVYDPWDPRTLNALVYNDSLEVIGLQVPYENELYGYFSMEAVVSNDFYEVELFNEDLLVG